MRRRSKRYLALAALLGQKRSYTVDQAVSLIKKFGTTKFDQTVQLSVHLNIDAKKADQAVRGSIALPHGIGKSRKVVVFADGDEGRVAQEAGADEVGMNELIEKVSKGWTEFDVAIAVQRAMKNVSRLGKVLGPKGLMPNAKNGTILPDGRLEEMRRAVREYKAGRVEFRNDNEGNVQVPVGKTSFPEENLRENIRAILDQIKSMRATTVKGDYILGAAVSASMSPAVPLEKNSL